MLSGATIIAEKEERRKISYFAVPITSKTNTARKIGFVAHFILVEGEVKYANNFDGTFDARQRQIKYVVALTKPLSHVKGKVKCSNNFDFTFDPRQRQSHICNSFATPLFAVKGEVKNAHSFDFTFGARQRRGQNY